MIAFDVQYPLLLHLEKDRVELLYGDIRNDLGEAGTICFSLL
jgi:hypothetical protein